VFSAPNPSIRLSTSVHQTHLFRLLLPTMSLILHRGDPQLPRESVAEARNVEPTILDENRRDLANTIRICRSLICLYKFNLLVSFRGMTCPRLLYSTPKIVAKWSKLHRRAVSLYLEYVFFSFFQILCLADDKIVLMRLKRPHGPRRFS